MKKCKNPQCLTEISENAPDFCPDHNSSPTQSEERKMKKFVKIGTPKGEYSLSWETYQVINLVENPNNSVVPFSIETCCGVYIPTSAADGHWERNLKLGGWEWEDEVNVKDFINSKGYKNKDETNE